MYDWIRSIDRATKTTINSTKCVGYDDVIWHIPRNKVKSISWYKICEQTENSEPHKVNFWLSLVKSHWVWFEPPCQTNALLNLLIHSFQENGEHHYSNLFLYSNFLYTTASHVTALYCVCTDPTKTYKIVLPILDKCSNICIAITKHVHSTEVDCQPYPEPTSMCSSTHGNSPIVADVWAGYTHCDAMLEALTSSLAVVIYTWAYRSAVALLGAENHRTLMRSMNECVGKLCQPNTAGVPSHSIPLCRFRHNDSVETI